MVPARYRTWTTPKRVALIQGVFYAVFGLWPLVNISTFQALTGPKADLWLVKIVGLLLAVDGLIMLAARLRRRMPLEIALLGAASALVLGAADVVYVLEGTICWIYLLDAVAEGSLLAGWIVALREHRYAFEYG